MKAATVLVSLLVLLSPIGCATTTTTSTTWVAPGSPGYWARPGRVESVQEIVRRVEGNPAGGALAGALIGGFLFGGGRGPASLFGAVGGAAVGSGGEPGVGRDAHLPGSGSLR